MMSRVIRSSVCLSAGWVSDAYTNSFSYVSLQIQIRDAGLVYLKEPRITDKLRDTRRGKRLGTMPLARTLRPAKSLRCKMMEHVELPLEGLLHLEVPVTKIAMREMGVTDLQTPNDAYMGRSSARVRYVGDLLIISTRNKAVVVIEENPTVDTTFLQMNASNVVHKQGQTK
jgi:hypothetical protein